VGSDEPTGRGCCSFVSCCGGFLGGALITAVALVVAAVVGWYYVPAWIEAGAARTSAVLEGPRRDSPTALAEFHRKVECLTSELSSDGPLDVTISLTDDELNAWVADTLLADGSSIPLQKAVVVLEEGRIRACLRIQGDDLATTIPSTTATAYLRHLLQRTGTIDVDMGMTLAVRDGRAELSLDSLRLGPVPLPVSLADGLIAQALGELGSGPDDLVLRDVKVEPGRVHLRATRRVQ